MNGAHLQFKFTKVSFSEPQLPPSLTFFSLVVSFAPTYLLKHLRKVSQACEIVVVQSSIYLQAFWDGDFVGA
jgi:hypothetical protein